METKYYSIKGYFDAAEFTVDFSSITQVVENSTTWAAYLLENAGTKHRIVDAIQRYNKWHPCRTTHSNDNSLIAIAPFGKKKCLAYKLEPIPGTGTRITPIPFLEVKAKIGIAFMLAIAFVLPVVLSPWVWRRYEQNNLLMSRYYLLSFCHYLESQLDL